MLYDNKQSNNNNDDDDDDDDDDNNNHNNFEIFYIAFLPTLLQILKAFQRHSRLTA